MVQFSLVKVAELPVRELSSGARPNRLSAKSSSLKTYTVRRKVVSGMARAPVPICEVEDGWRLIVVWVIVGEAV